MDSEHKHKVLASFNIRSLGMIVVISDVEFGFKKGMVLKSITSKHYWEVRSRILHSSYEKRFDGENEIISIANIRDVDSLKNRTKTIDSYEYIIKPIGHHEKPISGDFLVFTVTVAVRVIYKVTDIYDDYLLLDINNGDTGVLHKKYVADKVQIGDYVRHCEQKYHDLVDEFGNFICRE
ncbi:S1 domain-containing protein [Chryseobacterium wangxinyae]|uniref:hypothetical protein n=1 Tax=Chryseobacterium sp. CY353 TaxID=2997334 RepID=UPI00227178CF|nr:hypothetical protein [Chryseobacterium sp. CY353]MCY0969411.1 hypothetical protein [Chryseobacterium sp. CY353]